MKKITEIYSPVDRKIKVVQFGEGYFLRAFVDYMIDVANEKGVFDGGVAIVKPIALGSLDRFVRQKNLYTVSLRGQKDGAAYVENRVITCIQNTVDPYQEYRKFLNLAQIDSLQFIVSNTTEAGIVLDHTDRFDAEPPATYPGKLTRFLFERFRAFSGDPKKGLIILPVELIENNGGKLKECVMSLASIWKLDESFKKWVEESCVFCSTLVDRIVSGNPREEGPAIMEQLGYEDELLDVGEPFGLWVIESEKDISDLLPLDRAGQSVIFTKDQKPYRERKVKILNGAHTSTVLAGYLCGKNIVRECMEDPEIRMLMERAVYQELAPTVNLPEKEVKEFAASVMERFQNPFVKHSLLDISLNSVSKWKSRILPSLRENYEKNGVPPKYLTFSFAALLAFYTSQKKAEGALEGVRNGDIYRIRDDEAVLEFVLENSGKSAEEYVRAFAGQKNFWGEDLNSYRGFSELASKYLEQMRKQGMKTAVHDVLQEK